MCSIWLLTYIKLKWLSVGIRFSGSRYNSVRSKTIYLNYKIIYGRKLRVQCHFSVFLFILSLIQNWCNFQFQSDFWTIKLLKCSLIKIVLLVASVNIHIVPENYVIWYMVSLTCFYALLRSFSYKKSVYKKPVLSLSKSLKRQCNILKMA